MRAVPTLLATALVALTPGYAEADPVLDLIAPQHDPAAILPTPRTDPFYTPQPGFEARPPGALLAARVGGGLFPTARSLELLVRSTDSHDHPVPVVATLLLPHAAWTGPGPRPLVSYNIPISSVGHGCAPSAELKRGVSADLMAIQLLLAKNYAVVVPDHQGPRQAYAAGLMGGHAVLDSIRAVTRTPMPGLGPQTPVVLTGYSGGAIATGWAAQLAPAYAPEIRLAGAMIGGGPFDYELLLPRMDGVNFASGVLLAAALGLAREYPELLGLLNDNGWRVAKLFRDICISQETALGVIAPLRVDQLSDVPDPAKLPMVQQILAANRPGAVAPATPVFLFHGVNEIWIPYAGARHLFDEWCARGARVRLAPFPGEHFLVGALSIPLLTGWIEELLAGRLVPAGCTSPRR
ncbi:lipase family protein [Nocardia seriolae]|uniref:Lipase n=1 Tax=Nocardia seriolae TaxID=37332 RepID=A0A0B8N4G1_9NOCA|nr:lipase [Nocardia seriolae]GEM26243.1 putative lipase [Nocardia seriolae NBRC 15557]MTJ72278.1 lipase [Nocardia seriolae]MTJ88377.1 lipase [Nocardia seriolae]MTK32362.1 lipase [Nocardia seriolae]